MQRRKKEAQAYINQHDLNGDVRATYDSILVWLGDDAHTRELRDGLRDAWNERQAAFWRITTSTEELEVRFMLQRAGVLIEEAKTFFLPFPQRPERQYLRNRLQGLADDYREIHSEFSRRESDGTLSSRLLGRLHHRLRSADFLPLLERTLPDARRAELPLAEKLGHMFSERAAARQTVRYREIAPLIARATPGQRDAASNDDELMRSAAHLLAPEPHQVPEREPIFNDAPEFVQALDIQHQGRVVPHNPLVVDTKLRQVLGRWVRGAVARGTTVHGSTYVLKSAMFGAVEKKYSHGIGGGVNAFTEEGHIYLHAARGEPSTIIHEGVHLYSDGAFRVEMGGALDEGVTEYFARKVASTLGYSRTSYRIEFENADRFIGLLGEDTVAEAYFSGDMPSLRAVFIRLLQDRRTIVGDGMGQWADFKSQLRERHWDQAFRIPG